MVARYVFALAMAVGCVGSVVAAEEKSPDWNAETLSGDWGGTRSNLYNKGVEIGITHKSDVLSNLSGGLKRGTAWMGHTEATASMDLEKLLGWDATTAYVHFHSDMGSKINRDYVGAFMGVDNIETAANTAQFYHAWVQKSFSGDSLSVLAGLYPIDSEFYVTDTSGIFLQPPYGMANDLGQTNPPVFPMGALALRVKYTAPAQNFYVQYALTDGVPGDPNEPRGTHIQLNKGDGTLSIMELGFTPQENVPEQAAGGAASPEEGESFNKTAIGFWRYSSQFEDMLDPAVRRISQGVYFLAERTLSVEQDHPAQGLSGFVRFGTASKEIHIADWTGSLGLRYHGLIAGRDDDIAGVAVTVNHASSAFLSLMPEARSSETDVEATYRAQVNPWFAVQPTLQYILNPAMDPAMKNVWVLGVRAEITL